MLVMNFVTALGRRRDQRRRREQDSRGNQRDKISGTREGRRAPASATLLDCFARIKIEFSGIHTTTYKPHLRTDWPGAHRQRYTINHTNTKNTPSLENTPTLLTRLCLNLVHDSRPPLSWSLTPSDDPRKPLLEHVQIFPCR
jgi:hypothetical protein